MLNVVLLLVFGFRNIFTLEILSLNGSKCRALEVRKSLLEIEGISQFLIRFDLSALMANDVIAAYSRTGDDKGLGCISNMTALINQSLLKFKSKVDGYQRERMETDFYLKSEHPIGRDKRIGPGSIAILVSAG